MKIDKMTRQHVDIVHERLVEKLNSLAEELGLSLDFGGVKYNTTNGTFKTSITLTCEADNGMPISFEHDAPRVGLEKSDFGKVFNYNGNSYEIVNIKPKNRKYPIIVNQLRNGKTYKFSSFQVKTCLRIDSYNNK